MNKKLEWKKIILRLLLSLLIIGAILGLLYLILYLNGYTKITKEELQELIKKTGAWGPIVFILISFLQVTFIPIPSSVTILVGSYLFGVGLSFLYSYIGIIIGSIFAFFLGRKIGRPFVNWVVGDKEAVDNYLKKMRGKENVILFFMFLFPFFPDDAICSLAGILPISYIGFILMQLVTRATSIGGNLLFLSGEFIPFSGWGIPVLISLSIVAIVIFIICYKKADEINNLFYKAIDKVFYRKRNSEKKNEQ